MADPKQTLSATTLHKLDDGMAGPTLKLQKSVFPVIYGEVK